MYLKFQKPFLHARILCIITGLKFEAALHMQLVRSKVARPNVTDMVSSMSSIRPSSSNWVTSQQSCVLQNGQGEFDGPNHARMRMGTVD